MIEELTEEIRDALERAWMHGDVPEAAEALSIIESQATELETQREMVRTLLEDVNRKVDLLAAAEHRIASQRDLIRQLRIAIYELFQRAEAAEARLTTG